MKPRHHSEKRVMNVSLILWAAALAGTPLRADNGTWINNASSIWSTPGNWNADVVADGSGFTADFNTIDITGDRTVNLDSDRTLTGLIFGDADPGSAAGWILGNNGVSTNNLILAGTTPTITVNTLATNKTVSITALVQGSAGLTKAGGGTLVLSNTGNTFSGKIVIDGGTLGLAANGSLGSISGFLSDSITIKNSGTLRESAGGNNTLSSNRGITLNSGIHTIIHNGSGWFRIDGVISGAGGLDIRSDGGNDVRFGGINIYTGDTRLYSNLGMSTARCLEGTTLDYSTAYGGQLNYLTNSGFTAVTFGGLKGNKDLAFGTVALSVGNNNSDTSYGGILSDSGGSLTKIGSGKWTLGGNNTYSGPTNVNDGTLIINGTQSGAGAVTVSGIGRLGGNGSTNAALTIQSGGKFLVSISNWTGVAGSGFTDLAVAALDLTGALWTVAVDSTTSFANFSENTTTFPFLNTTGGIIGFNSANVSVSASGFSGSGTWSVQQNGNSLELVYTSGAATAYDTWSTTTHSLANPAFDFDSDKDCLENGIEWVLGGNPNANDNPSVLPTATGDDVNGLTLVFNRNSASIPETTLVVEWGSVLSGFSNTLTIGTVDVGPSGINPTIDIDAPSVGKVTVNIPAGNAVGGKILARLKATRP